MQVYCPACAALTFAEFRVVASVVTAQCRQCGAQLPVEIAQDHIAREVPPSATAAAPAASLPAVAAHAVPSAGSAMRCPKCGTPATSTPLRSQPVEACVRCGLRRDRANAWQATRAVRDDAVRAAWESCQADWSVPAAHAALLVLAQRSPAAAAEVARCYRERLLLNPEDATALAQLARLRTHTELQLTLPRHEAEARRQRGKRLTGLLLLLIVLALAYFYFVHVRPALGRIESPTSPAFQTRRHGTSR